MFEDDSPNPPPSSKDVAGEDFLFHLYRGSELLQDNRVHEAKQELEHALSLQPRDAKGQDLLAIVYFRLGLYPRAIAIYETLIQLHPRAATPRINLALCFLKTGQASSARTELERVLELSPGHSRAWGYLGLAFQRLGDYERACQAFVAGGHGAMARRLSEVAGLGPVETSSSGTDRALVGDAASAAFDALAKEGGAPREEPFRTDSEAHERRPSGMWAAVEPGREHLPEVRRSAALSPSILPSLAPSESLLPPLPSRADEPAHPDTSIPPPPAAARFDDLTAVTSVESISHLPSVPIAPSAHALPLALAERPEDFARKLLLVFPRHHTAALHASGLVLLQSTSSLAARFDMVRALTFHAGFVSTMLNRRARGRDLEEPLGGAASPLFRIEGIGNLVLGPSVGSRLSLIAVSDQPLFVRESTLVAMEGPVSYENGRLVGGDGDSIPMVQLRAGSRDFAEPGGASAGGATARGSLHDAVREPEQPSRAVVLALPQSVSSVEVGSGQSVLLRAHSILGWTGRIVPRTLAPSEAPGKMRGFISLAGEGMVIVDAR